MISFTTQFFYENVTIVSTQIPKSKNFGIKLGNLKFKLHVLCAKDPYFPVQWSWSTLSLSFSENDLFQIWQICNYKKWFSSLGKCNMWRFLYNCDKLKYS